MRWFTSDWHLGHTNIIKYCNRPFSSTDEMDEALIATANARLGVDDELWVLGDIALGPIRDSLARYRRLHCRLVVVTGNHDRCHPSYPGGGRDQWLDIYRELTGAAEIVNGNTVITLADGTEVHVSHFPRISRDRRPERIDSFEKFRPPHDGRPVIHGHTHGLWRQFGDHVDVGVDAWGGALVPEDALVGLFNRPDDLEALAWTLPRSQPAAGLNEYFANPELYGARPDPDVVLDTRHL